MGKRSGIFGILSLVMLGLTIITLLCYILIAINPYLPFNPFPPEPQMVLVATTTATPLPRGCPRPPGRRRSRRPSRRRRRRASRRRSRRRRRRQRRRRRARRRLDADAARHAIPWPFTYETTYETPYYGCPGWALPGRLRISTGTPWWAILIHVRGGGIDTVVNSGDKQVYGDSGLGAVLRQLSEGRSAASSACRYTHATTPIIRRSPPRSFWTSRAFARERWRASSL